ncbi:hypothetical protein FHR24_001067 [Wenyingzhuangia heitensis]|uniref:Por secretion system C-terminal sorting domain-containing protein n=1 Tax=Wenyingzhuangia heitensis TaxID=1487859 RepID=A0ABX0U8U6_9FLAO|nr:T9SS type A sorting domain-containing protein [Wenyingzhuangia heitensis]NIJ44628.1 hypothetical protein [Wenyingzhuangia heitensis]
MNYNYHVFFKKKLPLYVLLFISFISFSANIHVAKTGTDALTDRGTSSAPYKTINYVFNNGLISPGDHLVLHEGVYRETIIATVNNITIRPKDGDKVIVSGANWYGDSSWSDTDGDGIFELALSTNQVETKFTQLIVEGQHKQIARFPNNTSAYKNYIIGSNREMMDPRDQSTGFAVLLNGSKPAGVNQTGQITFSWHNGTPKLPDVTFTNEAIVRGFIGKLRNNIFSYSQDGGQVTRAPGGNDRMVTFKSLNTQGNVWGGDAAVGQPEGFGYVMDLSVLDYEGEWFWKKTENKMYYKPEGGTVSGKNFEIQRRQYVLKVQANNVTVENINFKVGEVELKNANATTISNCSFTYLSPYQYRRTYGSFRQGILLNNADNTTFDSCYIGHTWGSGIIILKGSDNSIVNNCYIEDIGWMGQFTIAVENNGNNTQITKNTFGKASRFHIRTTESVYAKIVDNDFYGAMSLGEDAGAIMFTSTGKSEALNMQGTVIAWNKIHGMKGIPAYDPQDYSNKKYLISFYLEDSENYTVHHNLTYDNNDEYTSVRLDGSGNPESTRNINAVAYMGPRTKTLTRKMNYYNNTFWDYSRFISFWQTGGGVNSLEMKNNLYVNDKENYIDAGAGQANKLYKSDFYEFTQAADDAPYNVSIVSAKNRAVSETNPGAHYVDAVNGNLRLILGSTYNNGGDVISGITTEANPTIGAWEGEANWQKERVFNAGSSLTNASFDSLANPSNSGLNIDDLKEAKQQISVSPNPFKNQLGITLGTEIKAGAEVLITILDFNGSVVFSQKIKAKKETENYINTTFLASGVYLLEIKYKEGRVLKKIIK